VKVSTKNEYGKLKSVIIGRIAGGCWPKDDLFFNRMMELSTYTKSKLKRGKIPNDIVEITEQELLKFKNILLQNNVNVYRPEPTDWSRSTADYDYVTTGMHTFSARDLLLSVGNKVIECPTPFISRQHEFKAYDVIKQEAMKDGCVWIAAPKARMEDKEMVIVESKMKLTERYPIFDAANVMKVNDKLLYLVSSTGNKAGANWLQNVVGTEFEVILWEDVYSHAHIDSTLISLGKDTVLLNGSRVNENNLPKFMQSYKKIYVNDMEEQIFYHFPYASKWIGMNILSIDPETVIVDPFYQKLIALLKNQKYNVITTPLTHSRTLGGGLHCVTCDLERE
tara:strand:- start:138 stop:1148 length:1011 start_codon:yes stop_codon:yes gene_type:complete